MKSVKQLLKEELESNTVDKNYVGQVGEFVTFAKEYLGIEDKMRIELHKERDELTTTAAYDTQNYRVLVYVNGRALVDILRSIAHELVHHKQNNEGRLTNTAEDGSDGSDIENEANATAGIIMRKYGKIKPEIYQ
jgi:hypothetical protein